MATNVNPSSPPKKCELLGGFFISVFTEKCVKHWWCRDGRDRIPYWADFDRISVTASSGTSRWRQQNLSGPSLLWTGFTITHPSAVLIKHSHKYSISSEKHMWTRSKKDLPLSISHRTALSLCSNNYNGDWHSRRLTVMRCVRKCVFLCVSAMMHF